MARELTPLRTARAPATSRTLWALARWVRAQPLAAAGVALLVVLAVVALVPSVLAAYDPRAQDVAHRLEASSPRHPLGTDQYGRDVLSRLIWGVRVSVAVALFSVGLSMALGTMVGTYAGYHRGLVDELVMRASDLLMSFPALLLGLAVVSALGPGLTNVVVAIGLALLPRFVRLARSLTLTVQGREFVDAARAIGATNARIMLRHIAPQIWGQIAAIGSLWTATAIRVEASLSFLGLGVSPPTPTLGNMVGDAVNYLTTQPLFTVYSSAALALTVLAFNLIGDAFQEGQDPRLRAMRGA